MLVYNPYNIDLHSCNYFKEKFDVSEEPDELENDVKRFIGAEEMILGTKGETIAAFRAGIEFDDFIQNKITFFFYHLPVSALSTH